MFDSRTPKTASVYRGVTYPDVEAELDQLERQASLLVRQANPNLRVHQQAVVQIDDPFPETRRSIVHLGTFLSPPPLQPMDAEEEAVLGLDDVFFGFEAPE